MRWRLAALLTMAACRADAPAPVAAASGDAGAAPFDCGACHREQVEAFARSHHARGQAEATPASVPEGRLPGGWAMAHDGGAVELRWPEADGGTGRGRVRYTLGAWPLVQVAVERPDGRLQVPPIGWVPDAGWRPVPGALEGPAGHWSTPSFNWNGGCAGCHASGLVVGAMGVGVFQSRWAALALDCAACHGDEAGHRAWVAAGRPALPGAGYPVRLGGRAAFRFGDGGAIARAEGAPLPDVQAEACAACHSRRRPLTDDGRAEGALLDRFEPALLAAGLYHPTGAVADEVYEVGSFLMSRMERAGVRCADCHQPHSGRLRAEGNALCAGCHRPEVFDVPAHHRHRADGPGGRCVACHAPPTTFLGVDVRRDHAFRVPEPVLARRLGAPDACWGCHPALSPRDAAAVQARRGGRARPEDAVAEAFAAAFAERLDARPRLLAVTRSPEASAFERASALALAAEAWGPGLAEALREAAGSADDWRRYGAATALAAAPPGERWALGEGLLADARRAVRVRAARALVGLGPVPAAAVLEAEAAERANGFRGEAWLNLGGLARAQGEPAEAERRLRQGLRVEPTFGPLRIDLADLLRVSGRDANAAALLEVGAREPGPWKAPLAYALGLARWRAGDRPGALEALERASREGPALHLEAWLLAVREVQGKPAGWARLEQAARTRPDSAVLLGLEAAWARADGLEARSERVRQRMAALEQAPDAGPGPPTGPAR